MAAPDSIDEIRLSSKNFDEIKGLIAGCSSFEELQEKSASGKDHAGASSAVALEAREFPEIQQAWRELLQRMARLGTLSGNVRELTGSGFGELVPGIRGAGGPVATFEQELDNFLAQSEKTFRGRVSFDLVARSVSGEVIFGTKVCLGSDDCSYLKGNEHFVEFVERHCLRPLRRELQERRAEACFEVLQQRGLVVDDSAPSIKGPESSIPVILPQRSDSLLCGRVTEVEMWETSTLRLEASTRRALVLSTFSAREVTPEEFGFSQKRHE